MKLKLIAILFMAWGTLQGMDDLEGELITRGIGLVPNILNRVSVLNQEIKNSDAVFGTITLEKVGSYMPLANLAADIEITGTNVILDLGGRSLFGSIKISGSTVVVKNGAIMAHAPYNRDDLNAAISIHENATNVLIKRCHVVCADSVLTGSTFELILSDTVNIVYEQVVTGSVFESMPGRSGIEVMGDIVNVFDCSILPGASADTDTLGAEQGGHGIVLSGSANKVRVLDCTTLSGNGGSSISGSGGDAGYGICVKDTASHAEISHCTIFGTGAGGDGSTQGGNGGHGICIESTADDIGVHDCRIRNTGLGGSPSGSNGKAVKDEVIIDGKKSQIFCNFAHNISNEIKFDLMATNTERGIASPNPPDSTVLNPFANIYVP